MVRPDERPRRRVAVVDDEVALAVTLPKYLNGHALEAKPFFSFAAVTAELTADPFDGYILVILTGQIERGNVPESEIAIVCSTYRIQNLDKPARLSSVLSLLEAGFEAFPASV